MSTADLLHFITLNEFLGTAILVLLGCGIGALGALKPSLGYGSTNWTLVALGWGMAVFVGASVAWKSGAHLNPAVTFGLVLTGSVPWSEVPYYLLGQMLGAIVGAFGVYVVYKKQFDEHDEPETTGGIFYTSSKTRHLGWNTLSEAVATFVLIYWILQQAPWQPGDDINPPDFGNMGLGYAGVAFAVLAIGAGLGGATGYALNPARDLGPRIAYALMPIKGKGRIDWGYAIVPIVGPLLGAAVAAGLFQINY